jgi:uncharacterized membrane protein
LRPAFQGESGVLISDPMQLRQKIKLVLKYLLAAFFVLAGANHFRAPALYLKIMPAYLPWPLFLVYLSGVFEMLFGALVLIPQLSRLAGWGLILLLIAVLPANFQMALHPGLFPQFNPALLWFRIPFQAVFIAWVYWCTQPGQKF